MVKRRKKFFLYSVRLARGLRTGLNPKRHGREQAHELLLSLAETH